MGADIVAKIASTTGMCIGAILRVRSYAAIDAAVMPGMTDPTSSLAITGPAIEATVEGDQLFNRERCGSRRVPRGQAAASARAGTHVRVGECLAYKNCAPDESVVATQIRRRIDQLDAQYVAS